MYEVSINSKYYYRGMTVQLEDSNDEDCYVEILVNINSEKSMVKNFTKTLILGTCIVIIFSIFVSYYLSRKALEPIISAYKKQTKLNTASKYIISTKIF